MNSKNILYLLTVLFLFSCSFEPTYHPPETNVSTQWKAEEEVAPLADVRGWWEIFDDPRLNELIAQASENNPDLMAAAERVDQARDMAKIVRSRLFPHLSLTPGYRNTTFLNTYPFGPNSTHSFTTKSRVWEYEYSLPLSIMNFEVDLWGQIRNEYKAAKLSMEAQKEALQAALLVLTAEVANAYFQIRIQDTQIDLLREIMDTRRNALDIQSSRFQGEVINYTDVAAARQALDAFEAQYDAAKMLRTLYENQIAVLIGSIPSEFTLEKNSLPIQAQPPRVPAGLPSEMLLRRPDLAQQERMMASYHALIGVAYASYFPALFLTADFGFRSPDWSHFLKESSKFWRIGADVSQFIFDAGKRKYQVELSWAEFRESADIYRQKVLIAFQEVEDSLSNLEWIAKGMESLKDAIAAAKTNYTIASDRYQLGVINYLDVTDTKLRELENQSAYLMLLGQQYGNTVQLIKALGGGWDSTGRKLEVRK